MRQGRKYKQAILPFYDLYKLLELDNYFIQEIKYYVPDRQEDLGNAVIQRGDIDSMIRVMSVLSPEMKEKIQKKIKDRFMKSEDPKIKEKLSSFYYTQILKCPSYDVVWNDFYERTKKGLT